MGSSLPSAFAPGLGMRTGVPWVSSVSTLCHPWTFCWALHVAGAPWRVSHFPARAQTHKSAARVPPPRVPPRSPSPDGLCQASSAASLTPQQLLGQGRAGTQLAGVPPSLGAAGMLGGTGGGGWRWSFRGDLVPLYTCGAGLPGARRTESWRRAAQDRRALLGQL